MLRGQALSEARNPLNAHESNGGFCPRVEIKLSGVARAGIWSPACSGTLIAKELSFGCREKLKVNSEPLLRRLFHFLQNLENAYRLLLYSKDWLGYAVSKCLGQIWKIRNHPGRNGWPFIWAPKDMGNKQTKKDIGLKTKVESFPGREEPRKGPRSSPLPRAPFSLGILSFESESLSGSNANTGFIVILQRGSPTRTAFYPPGASLGLSHGAMTPAASQEGLYPGWCLEISADLLHKSCQVNPFAVPWEMSSQGQSLGAVWLDLGVWVRIDGGQDLYVWSYPLLRILGWALDYLESSRKILDFTNQAS